MANRIRFLFGKTLRLEHAFMRPDRQVIADSHRQAVGDQVGCADDQDDAQRDTATGHTGDHGKRRDDAVVRPQISSRT